MRSLRVVPPGELAPVEDSPDEFVDPAGAARSTSTQGSGDAIVVEAEDGEQFQLTFDDAGREALREVVGSLPAAEPAPARGRTGQGHPLSPREIQTRVRAGESAQDLADDSGTSMDKIMRFAYAVIEERSRVADEARRARARRDGDGNLVPFGETVDARFTAASIEPQSVEWDSFRRPDGSWVVSAAWTTDGTERIAHWAFSLTARTVLPLDQVSSDLLSDRPLRPVVRAVPDATEDASSSAAAELYDQEAPHEGGYTAPAPPTGWLRGAASVNAATADPASSAAIPGPGRSSSASAAPPAKPAAASPETPETANNPPLPLRLADPWSGDEAESTAVEDTATTGDDMDGEGVDGIHVGEDTRLDELFDDDFIDDAPKEPSDAAPLPPPVSSGRSRSSRSQSKVPRWDDILLSTRRKND
jgi:hypothetical protein